MIQNQRFHIQSLAQKKYSKKNPVLKTADLHGKKASKNNNKIDWNKATDIIKNGIDDAIGDELGKLFDDASGNAMGYTVGNIIGDNIDIDNTNHTLFLLPLMSLLLIAGRLRRR